MNADLILFLVLAVISVVTALGMLISRNTVYCTLNLVMNFMTIALFYLLLGGPFIALSQVTVYAGAIMVLFLFVIMLLGVDRLQYKEVQPFQRPLSIILGVALIAEAIYILFFRGVTQVFIGGDAIAEGFGSPRALADVLFNQYALPIEVIAIILLVAMVGAIALTKKTIEKGLA